MKKNILFCALFCSIVLVTSAFALVPPSGSPPSGDEVYAPLNVSPSPQTKFGGLTIGSAGSGLLKAANKLLVGGTPSATFISDPAYLVEIQGNLGASKYCNSDGTGCKTLAELGGGGGGTGVSNSGGWYGSCNVSYPGDGSLSCNTVKAPAFCVDAQTELGPPYFGTTCKCPTGYQLLQYDSAGNIARYACYNPSAVGGGGASASGGASYVGATTATYTGAGVGGYDGGDAKCAAQYPGSRMAVDADFANGRPTVSGWYNIFSVHYGGATNSYLVDNCGNWGSSSTTKYGPAYNTASGPQVNACDASNRILCSL